MTREIGRSSARASPSPQPTDALDALAPLLECPRCRHESAALAMRAENLVCSNCRTAFPIYRSGAARIPWLFRDPEAAQLEWRSRYQGFLRASAAEKSWLERALAETRRRKTAAARIAAQLEARDAQRKAIVDLLGPIAVGAARSTTLERTGVLHPAARTHARDSSRCDALFRDWSWDSGENESIAECVRSALRKKPAFKPDRMLTLGAGACRFSYDLHRRYAPRLSIALDPNPLLLFVAGRVIHGDMVTLHEFPAQPLNKASFAVARRCAAPEPLSPTGAPFAFVLADPRHAPFKPASFDAIATTGLTDQAQRDPVGCIRAVNRLLASGGVWLNTGSFAFSPRNEASRYSEEEILELVASNGFDLLTTERHAIPFLQSPASGTGRIEHVLSFCAVKVADAPASERSEETPWLVDTRRAIPDLDEFAVASTQRLLQAQILGAVDGKRSLTAIAQLIAKHYSLQPSEAEGAVRRTLLELYETSRPERPDPIASLE